MLTYCCKVFLIWNVSMLFRVALSWLLVTTGVRLNSWKSCDLFSKFAWVTVLCVCVWSSLSYRLSFPIPLPIECSRRLIRLASIFFQFLSSSQSGKDSYICHSLTITSQTGKVFTNSEWPCFSHTSASPHLVDGHIPAREMDTEQHILTRRNELVGVFALKNLSFVTVLGRF